MTQLRAEGKIRNRELGFRAKDGRWVETSASISLMQDPNGQVLGSLGVVRDITDRKKAEAAQREAEELRTITILATTTAHEINNPLLVVKGRLEMLSPRLPEDSTERKWIEQSLVACARIQEMVARMQRIARVQYLEGESRSLPRLFDLPKASDTEESPGTPPPPASPKSRQARTPGCAGPATIEEGRREHGRQAERGNTPLPTPGRGTGGLAGPSRRPFLAEEGSRRVVHPQGRVCPGRGSARRRAARAPRRDRPGASRPLHAPVTRQAAGRQDGPRLGRRGRLRPPRAPEQYLHAGVAAPLRPSSGIPRSRPRRLVRPRGSQAQNQPRSSTSSRRTTGSGR